MEPFYTPPEAAVELIGQQLEQLDRVLDYLGAEHFPQEYMLAFPDARLLADTPGSTPSAVLARDISTAAFEDLVYAGWAAELGLTPWTATYFDDAFNTTNPGKVDLVIPTINWTGQDNKGIRTDKTRRPIVDKSTRANAELEHLGAAELPIMAPLSFKNVAAYHLALRKTVIDRRLVDGHGVIEGVDGIGVVGNVGGVKTDAFECDNEAKMATKRSARNPVQARSNLEVPSGYWRAAASSTDLRFDISGWYRMQAVRAASVVRGQQVSDDALSSALDKQRSDSGPRPRTLGASSYYPSIMAAATCFALFEDFDSGPNDKGARLARFNNDIVMPAIRKVKADLGLTPVIVRLPSWPQMREIELPWTDQADRAELERQFLPPKESNKSRPKR